MLSVVILNDVMLGVVLLLIYGCSDIWTNDIQQKDIKNHGDYHSSSNMKLNNKIGELSRIILLNVVMWSVFLMNVVAPLEQSN